VNGALGTALAVETVKARASVVLRATTVLFVAGVCVLSGAMVAAVRSGRTDIAAKLGPAAAAGDWPAFLSVATQVTAAAAVLATGVGLAWSVGREFADGTVSGLFGLPVSRGAVALAKLGVFVAWAGVLAVLLPVAVLVTGVVAGLGAPGAEVAGALLRLALLVGLSALLAVPVALAATLGRGLLPGVATAVGLLAVAQVGATVGSGTWFPLTAPALWAIDPTSVPAASLALVPVLPLGFGAVTVVAWRRLQLDR
jgi:ABC-2 type transport system permease protein